MGSQKSTRGFTIAELLVVIVVIAILATIVIQSYQGVQRRATATVVIDTLKKVENSLHLNAAVENLDQWWDDDAWTSYDGKPPLTVVISETGFNDYFQRLPELPGVSPDDWTYDNDLDTYGGCSTSSDGVNIYIFNYNDQSSAQLIDDQLDDGNLGCGRLRYDSQNRLLWSLDRDRYINN